jgi:hypothetical protein
MFSTIQEARKKLRNILSDGDKDKYVYRKKIYGTQDGVNVFFKTFEKRRVTNFTDPSLSFPLGVWKNNVRLTVSDFVYDDPLSGEFQFAVAPTNSDLIEATYYHQDFLDSDLDEFLESATQWLKLGTDITKVPDGLIPAAIHYAAQEAYARLALWHSRRLAEIYLTEDLPDEQTRSAQNSYLQMSQYFHKKAIELRDSYYSGAGQENAPLFGVVAGNISDITPKR